MDTLIITAGFVLRVLGIAEERELHAAQLDRPGAVALYVVDAHAEDVAVATGELWPPRLKPRISVGQTNVKSAG